MKKLTFITFTISIFLYSCSNFDDEIKIENTISKEIKNEKIFKAIFFLEGDFAKKIEGYRPLAEQIEKTLKENINFSNKRNLMISDIYNTINNQNPELLYALTNSIETKKLDSITILINQLAHLTHETAFKKNYIKLARNNYYPEMDRVVPPEKGGGGGECLVGPAVVAAAVWEVAVAVNVVAAASVAVWKYAYLWGSYENVNNGKLLMSKEKTLEKQKFIISISKILE